MLIAVAPKKKRIKKFPQPKLLTYEDYARLTPPDSGNYELHNGNIVFMPSPSDKHQFVVTDLTTMLNSYVKTHKLGRVIVAPMDTQLSEVDILQPDILFVSNQRLGIIDKIVNGAPDLVVEILSPSNDTKEMSYKKYVYETAGVQEYWLVNLEKQTITQYELIENELRWQRTLTKADTLESVVLAGFSLALDTLF
jgi:Uma2 family endonuclease